MVKEMMDSIDFIYNQQKELSVFGGIGALLGWDQMTYMPKNGASDRLAMNVLYQMNSGIIFNIFHQILMIWKKRINMLLKD